MAPTVAPSLQFDCLANPSGGFSCPNPSNIRLYSVAHGIPIDLGSGTGMYSLIYNLWGSDCTLLEYDLNSFEKSKKIFGKFERKNSQNNR